MTWQIDSCSFSKQIELEFYDSNTPQDSVLFKMAFLWRFLRKFLTLPPPPPRCLVHHSFIFPKNRLSNGCKLHRNFSEPFHYSSFPCLYLLHTGMNHNMYSVIKYSQSTVASSLVIYLSVHLYIFTLHI